MPSKRFPAWVRVCGAVVLAAGAWAVISLAQTQEKKPAPGGGARLAKVVTGTLDHTVRVTGTTAAREYATIAAPMMRGPDMGRALVLIYLAKSGGWVKKGNVVAEIDAQQMKDHIDGVQADILGAEADIKKRKAEQAIDWENLQHTLRTAKATLDKAKLENSASEIRMPIDAEMLKLAVEEAEAQYRQLQADVKTKQEVFRAEIRILELTKERHVRHLGRHQHDIERCTIRTPMEGLVVMQSFWRSGQMAQIEQGDQVGPGQGFMKIVNPASMMVDATVSQVGSDEIRIGQPATIRFDAFPDLVMKGKVYSMGAIATGGWRQNSYLRTLPVRLAIAGVDLRVIPDLSVSADVVTERRENALLVPLEAVQARNGKHYVAVWTGQGFEAREVKVGLANNTQAAVSQGLRAGEEVALDPAAALSAPRS